LEPLREAVRHPADLKHSVEIFGPIDDHRLQVVPLDRLVEAGGVLA
jgi:hypothetical protein